MNKKSRNVHSCYTVDMSIDDRISYMTIIMIMVYISGFLKKYVSCHTTVIIIIQDQFESLLYFTL